MHHGIAFSSFLFAAATLVAQPPQPNVTYTDGNVAMQGSRNAFPWGSNGIRYQQIVDAAVIGNGGIIQDLFVTGDPNNGPLEIHYTDIEILMGHTAQANPPVADWDTNLPPANATTVYRGPLRVYLDASQWNPVGLPRSYAFNPTAAEPNLAIEVIIRGIEGRTLPSNFYFAQVSGTAGGGRAFRYDWVSNPQPPLTGTSSASRLGILFSDGNFKFVGSGCAGSGGTPTMSTNAGTWPQVGTAFMINLSGAAPVTPAALAIGTSFTNFGGVPLPFDLTPLGWTGCTAYVNHVVVLGTATDAAGNATLPIGIPMGSNGVRIYTQWINVDPAANPAGLTTSNFGTIISGT